MSEDAFRLKVVLLENGEVHIHGNRVGLRDLANVCAALSALSDEDARTPANHVIYADSMNTADEGSVPMMVCLSVAMERCGDRVAPSRVVSHALEQTAGSHSLATAAHRKRYGQQSR